MNVTQILSFLAVSILLTLAPGPDILFVITQSVSRGKKSGIIFALGLCTGLCAHTTAASLGISFILYQSAYVFQVVKYIGAAYLIYLGIQALREKNEAISIDIAGSSQEHISAGKLYARGFFMNILNPKVSLFFLGFLPQFVSAAALNPSFEMLMLGLLFILQALCIFSIVSFISHLLSHKIVRHPFFTSHLKRIKAILFIAIGVKLACSER
jgi:threonine/homoserine/homoserine lactone efflux protein